MAKNKKNAGNDVINMKGIVEEVMAEQEHPQDDLPLSDTGKKAEETWRIRKGSGLIGIKFRKDSDLDPLEDLLTKYFAYAKSGEYEKIRPTKEESVDIKSFIKTYKPATSDLGTQERDIAQMLIEIGKSIYEYDGEGFANHESNPLLSDEDYRELISAWNNPAHAAAEPTGIVPVNRSGKQKMPLRYPTLSNNLEKTYRILQSDEVPTGVKEEDSVESFIDRVYDKLGLKDSDTLELMASPKLDGVSVNTTISDGRFRQAATRGDATSNVAIKGLDGYDIVGRASAKLDDKMKKSLRTAKAFGAQYEAFVLKSDVNAAAKAIGTTYINCRSAASGIINRMTADSKTIGLSKYLRFYPINTENADNLNYIEGLRLLDMLCVIPADMIPRTPVSGNKAELIEKIKALFNEYSAKRKDLSYDIDGMVISVVKDEYQEKIGREGRTNQWQIAMKFAPESSEGIVTGLSISYGNKGRRSIMLDLKEPAVISGVSYPQVQILSTRDFAKMRLKKGSRIEIVRTGDAIPAFAGVLSEGDGEVIKLPETCPACGEKLEVGKDGHLRCTNEDCPANIVGLLTNAFITLNMENYNAAFAEKLVSKVGVKRVVDLLDLTEEKMKKAGVSGKIEDAFINEFTKAVAKSPDYALMAAIGMPNVGVERSKAFLKAFTLDEFKGIKEKELEELLTKKAGAKTMAPVFAKTLIENRDDILKLVPAGKKTDFNKMLTIGHTGMKIPVELCDKIVAYGWAVTENQNFDILVAADPSSKSRKITTAMKKGIPVITMKYLEDNINNLENLKAMVMTMTETKKNSAKPENKPAVSKVIELPAPKTEKKDSKNTATRTMLAVDTVLPDDLANELKKSGWAVTTDVKAKADAILVTNPESTNPVVFKAMRNMTPMVYVADVTVFADDTQGMLDIGHERIKQFADEHKAKSEESEKMKLTDVTQHTVKAEVKETNPVAKAEEVKPKIPEVTSGNITKEQVEMIEKKTREYVANLVKHAEAENAPKGNKVSAIEKAAFNVSCDASRIGTDISCAMMRLGSFFGF